MSGKNPRRRQDAALGQGRPARIKHTCCVEGCVYYHRPTADFYPLFGKANLGLFECREHHERRLSREQWPAAEYPDNKQE